MFFLKFILIFLICDLVIESLSSYLLKQKAWLHTEICTYYFQKCFLLLILFIIGVQFLEEINLLLYFVSTKNFLWFYSHTLRYSFLIYFDLLTYLMLIVIFFISSLVHLYSLEYMSTDIKRTKFIILLSIFTYFMACLIIAQNLLVLFFAWEGVGLCSYLLISFWQSRIQAIKAALKAMIINKFGDIFLFFGILYLYYITKRIDLLVFEFFDFSVINNHFFFNTINIIGFCFILGAFTKSAQFLFHTWLPDAMEGPTPVSALIHAATMVAAGVFLAVRLLPLLIKSLLLLNLILIIGGITAIYAARMAVIQKDIKKTIAYSTCSQLGYMFMAVGLGFVSFAIFHLIMHAFYKALLFLCAGSVIHGLHDEQDIRRLGGLYILMPLTYSAMVIGSLALIGFPFFSGFYSKDLIIYVLTLENVFVKISYILASFGALFTNYYTLITLKSIFLPIVVLGTNISVSKIHLVQESQWRINLVLIILSVCSLWLGFYMKIFFICEEHIALRLFS